MTSFMEFMFYINRYLRKFILFQCQDGAPPVATPLDPNIPVVVLPGTDWSFQVLTRVPFLRQTEAPIKVFGSPFCS